MTNPKSDTKATPENPAGRPDATTGPGSSTTDSTAFATFRPIKPASLDTLPKVPREFTPENLARYRGYFPKQGQLAAMQAAATDLESFTDAKEVLGAAAPPLPLLLEYLQDTMQWAEHRRLAEKYLEYARNMEARNWKWASKILRELDTVLQAVAAQNSQVAVDHPGITRLLDATKEIGKAGAATRKKNRAAKALKPKA